MRVISGKAKGHKLTVPAGNDIRPTTDRLKETLFNIIAFELEDCTFLDLFSGTGSIGIEALSRGAAKAFFIDSSKEAQECIRNNLIHTKLMDQAAIIGADVQEIMPSLEEKFDIIFMDPPYKKEIHEKVIHSILKQDLLSKEGMIIVERGTQYDAAHVGQLEIWKQREYKTTAFDFYRHEVKE